MSVERKVTIIPAEDPEAVRARDGVAKDHVKPRGTPNWLNDPISGRNFYGRTRKLLPTTGNTPKGES